MAQKIALITGSTRTPRVGPRIASWIGHILFNRPQSGSDNLEIESLDLSDFDLPIFNEPLLPARVTSPEQFTYEHTKRWSAAIRPFAGYIWVIPEYNGGLAGATKNAIDYLYNEWTGKPVVVISYGIYGATRASEQLSFSLGTIQKLKVVPTKVLLAFGHGPVLASASTEGEIPEDQLEKWVEDGKKDEMLKAWEELRELLEETAKADAEKQAGVDERKE